MANTAPITQEQIPHHFADGNADGGYTIWKEMVVDQPITAKHLALLASETGYVSVNANIDNSQRMSPRSYDGVVDAAHYAPLVFETSLAALVIRAAQTKRRAGRRLDFVVSEAGGGSGSLYDHQTRKPLVMIRGDFTEVLAAAGYRQAGWVRG